MQTHYPTLYIEINNLEYIFLVGKEDEKNNFKIIYKCNVPSRGIENDRISDFDLVFNDIKENIWFSINLEDVQKITDKKFSKFIVYLEDKNIKMPKPKKITIDVPNNHLKYAITWYSISISVLFYYLYFRKKK